MIVIRATGSSDVKSLKRLARSLSAAPSDISLGALEELDRPAPPPRKSGKPTVSTLAGATIAPATLAAMAELQQVDVIMTTDYEDMGAD